MDAIHLDEPELDPEACLRHLNALVSPHPYDLEPVRPLVTFDLSRYKFVEENVVAGLDSRPDLLQLKPVEFEHLDRELFEAMGMKSWVTQASRDDGVDAVVINEDAIIGGLCVIQAKRYSRIVGLEAVNALAGVMDDKHAAKGILVTTSWVGQASREFAARNGRMTIIEGRQLRHLLKEHLHIDVLIGLDRVPPDWTPPAWPAHGRSGTITVDAQADVLIVEGVGAADAVVSPLTDVAIWVQSDYGVATARGIARDGDDEAALEDWRMWSAAENEYLARARPWERASLVVCGTPETDPGTGVVLVGRTPGRRPR